MSERESMDLLSQSRCVSTRLVQSSCSFWYASCSIRQHTSAYVSIRGVSVVLQLLVRLLRLILRAMPAGLVSAMRSVALN